MKPQQKNLSISEMATLYGISEKEITEKSIEYNLLNSDGSATAYALDNGLMITEPQETTAPNKYRDMSEEDIIKELSKLSPTELAKLIEEVVLPIVNKNDIQNQN